MKKQFLLKLAVFTMIGCSKEEHSIVGKWYYSSKDTKMQIGGGCDLRDTTVTYARTNTPLIIELTVDGNYLVSYPNSTVSFKGTYTYTSGILKTSVNGLKDSTEVSNVSADGWRIVQKNYVWCPSKTAFNEYINYKKY